MHKINKTQFNIFYLMIAAFALIISHTSCESDFAKKEYQPDLHNSTDTVFITQKTNVIPANFDLKVPNRSWTIVSYPNFIEPSATSGVTKGGTSINLSLTIRHIDYYIEHGIYKSEIVFDVKGYGLVTFPVQYFSYGNPTISLNTQALNLWDDAQGELSLRNNGNGILVWEITKLPQWMTVETTSEKLGPYSDYQIRYKVNSKDLEMGNYTSEIVIQNNVKEDIHLTVNLTVNAFSSLKTYQEGVFIGSKFISKTNQVIAVSRNPNRILVFTYGQTDPTVTELNRVPSCVALSEDENTLAIGFTNTEISTYDARSKALLKTYNLDAVPDNIEYGSANYLYYLSSSSFNDDYKYLNSLDLTSGATVKTEDDEGGIRTLKKIPNKNIIITSMTQWSPEHLILYYHTDKGIVKDKNTYNFSPYGLWVSDNGQQITTGQKVTYEIPTFDIENAENNYYSDGTPPVMGKFELPGNNHVHAIASQSSTGQLYVANGENYFGPKTYVHIFNYSTFVEQKTYEFASYPPSDHPSCNTWWEKTLDLYPFNDGSKLWLIQEFPGKDYDSPKLWGIRLLELK